MPEPLIEFRTVVEYDDGHDDQLLYGPDLEDGAEKRARDAAKRFRGRDFEAATITVERREVQPWEVVVAHHQPDTAPPHPCESCDGPGGVDHGHGLICPACVALHEKVAAGREAGR